MIFLKLHLSRIKVSFTLQSYIYYPSNGFMLLKQLSIIPILFLLVMVSFSPAFAQQTENEITNKLTVSSTCGINGNTLTAIQFGSENVNTNSARHTLTFTMDGSVPSVLGVYAHDWFDTSGTVTVPIMEGENTRYSFVDAFTGEFSAMTQLNGTLGTDTGPELVGGDAASSTYTNQAEVTSYWEVEVLLDVTSFTGEIEQSMTFGSACVYDP